MKAQKMKDLAELVRNKANSWLESPVIDQITKDEVKNLLLKPEPKELIDSFYKDLEFGRGAEGRNGCWLELYEQIHRGNGTRDGQY